jgi:RimJ/RimL family protein N-acetyltransferase
MDIVNSARRLRASGKIKESFDLVLGGSSTGTIPGNLLWQHQTFFWDDIAAGNCMLTRRKGSDAGFIRMLWDDREFVYRFHRLAARLPQQQADLERILNSEYASLITDLNSLHWIVRDQQRKPWGILSLTNISVTHQRAEVLLGVKPGAPFGLATAAMLLLFRFYFEVMKFQKLYTLTFDDNEHSLRGVLHLGFKTEGRFRKHFHDASANTFVDMVQAGLLAEDAFSAGNKRLMQRLNFN